MARKKTRFGWVRDDVEVPEETGAADASEEEASDDDVREVSNRRDAGLRDELERMVVDMGELPPSVRRALPLEPEALAELETLVRLPRTRSARRRQLKRMKGLLLGADLDAIQAAMEGDTPRAAHLREVERWRTRILEGGDDDIQAFVEAHPQVDRQQLRALAREARGDTPAASAAARRLFEQLRDA